jgi:branched-chain amino acid aminotransferase
VPITKTDYIWMDGELVNWDDANVHILTHTLHYGCGVFEGIRAYATAEGPGVFRLTDHIARLFNSAKIFLMDIPFSQEQIVEAVKHTVAANKLTECYIRPLAYLGYGEMGLNPLPCTVRVAIAVWPWGAYLGEEGIEKGVRVKISSWQRHDPNAMPPAAKGTGMYINSSMAKVEALKAGYDEAVLLSPQGYVSECTGENIFVLQDDRLLTPPSSAGALEGPWHRGGAREHIAQRPLHRRRSVHERYRGRGGTDRLGRRPPGRRWGSWGCDPQDPRGL